MLDLINENKIMPILRGVEKDDALFIVECLQEANMNVLEISLNQPNSLEVLEYIAARFGKEMRIGAGTVLTEKMAYDAKDVGATFFLSPNISESVAKVSKSIEIPYIPGALTPTEIQFASELGAELIKVFPVRQLGATYIKDVLASLNKVNLLAVGGVDFNNMQTFFAAGVKGIGVGSNLYEKEWIEKRDKKKMLNRLNEYQKVLKGEDR